MQAHVLYPPSSRKATHAYVSSTTAPPRVQYRPNASLHVLHHHPPYLQHRPAGGPPL